MSAKAKKTEVVEIHPINMVTSVVKVESLSSLVCHRFPEKARKEMLDKQTGKAKKKKQPKDPEADYKASLYPMGENGKYGFPAAGFKKAAVSACRNIDGFPMALARGAFHVTGELVEIKGKPTMREDVVRLQGSTADIRHRGEFKKWSADIPVLFNADVISLEQLYNLFELAGFAVGIGDWRPERNGSHGTFMVKRGE